MAAAGGGGGGGEAGGPGMMAAQQGVGLAGDLLKNYLQQQHEKKLKAQELARQAQAEAFAQRSKGIEQMGQGQQEALARLMAGFNQALG